MIRNVRDAFPEAYITVAVNSAAPRDVIAHSGVLVDDIVICNLHLRSKKTFESVKKLRRKCFDIGIANSNTSVTRAKFFFGLINVKKKIGMQFSSDCCLDKLGDRYHFVDAHLMGLEGFLPCVKKYNPTLMVSSEEMLKFREKFKLNLSLEKPVVGICVGRADISYKNHLMRKNPVYTRGWGELDQHINNMTDLVLRCVDQGYTVVLIGGKAEGKIKDEIIQRFKSCVDVKDMVGKTNLSESMALVSLCKVVVGVDTGMQHVSDAIGTNTVSLFGPTNPRTHGAYSSKAQFIEVDEPCRYCYGTRMYTECTDRKCMKRINVDSVFEAIKLAVQE